MPAVSKAQRTAACLALAAKKGKKSPDMLKASAKKMYEDMSTKQLEHYCRPEPKG